MSRILIVHLANALGLHFFDWSLNFLTRPQGVHDPRVTNTAHNWPLYKILDPQDLNSFVERSDRLVCHSWAISQSVIETTESHSKNIQHALDLGFKVVIVDWAKHHWLIPAYQTRYPLRYSNLESATRDEVNREWMDMYFPGTSQCWSEMNTWDRRESLALCLRPLDISRTAARSLSYKFHERVDYLDTKDLWFDMQNIVNHYVAIDPAQLEKWIPIYQQWQKVHDTNFSEDYWAILHDIVQGVSRDLSPYQIDFTKEALIQHGLIFAYNLNLKTWQLDQFPTDTQSLTLLLEPNIHSRDFTYNLHY